jgi:hypothetical protein
LRPVAELSPHRLLAVYPGDKVGVDGDGQPRSPPVVARPDNERAEEADLLVRPVGSTCDPNPFRVPAQRLRASPLRSSLHRPLPPDFMLCHQQQVSLLTR